MSENTAFVAIVLILALVFGGARLVDSHQKDQTARRSVECLNAGGTFEDGACTR